MAVLVAAAVVPAARSEDPPGDRTGRPTVEQAKDRAREHAERSKERARAHAERAKERAAERAKQRAERLREKAQKERRGDAKREARCGEVLAMGEVLEVGDDSVLVEVARSNHGRLRGHEVRFQVKDKTGFKGAEGLEDLGEGDSVLIHARACKLGEQVQYLAGRVEVKERAAPVSDEEAEDEEAEDEESAAEEESDEESEPDEDAESEDSDE